MPFIGLLESLPVVPTDVGDKQRVVCPDCGGEMGVRDGDVKIRHFWHFNGRSEGCGESDEHKRMKAIAASKAHDEWPESEIAVSLEEGVGKRRADVLVEFPDGHPRFGEALAIEVQYRNKGKDRDAWERDAHTRGVSVLWLEQEQFDEKDVALWEGDISPAWPSKTPSSEEWGGTHDNLLADFQDGNYTREAAVPNFWWAECMPPVQEREEYHPIIQWLRQEKPSSTEVDVVFPEEPMGKQDALAHWAAGATMHDVEFVRDKTRLFRYNRSGWFMIGLWVSQDGQPRIHVSHRGDDDHSICYKWNDLLSIDTSGARNPGVQKLGERTLMDVKGTGGSVSIVQKDTGALKIMSSSKGRTDGSISTISNDLAECVAVFFETVRMTAELLPVHKNPESWVADDL
jgi:hypothetical protein